MPPCTTGMPGGSPSAAAAPQPAALLQDTSDLALFAEPGLDDVGGFEFELDLILDGLQRLRDSS